MLRDTRVKRELPPMGLWDNGLGRHKLNGQAMNSAYPPDACLRGFNWGLGFCL
jgi:hypothetical protein